MRRGYKILNLLLGSLVLGLSSLALAAPGTLSQLPLLGQSTTQANLMILLDSSTSMYDMTPYLPYDSAVTYGPCPSANDITTYVNANMGAGTLDMTKPIGVYGVGMPSSGKNAGTLEALIQYYKCSGGGTCTTGGAQSMQIPISSFGYTAGKVCFNATQNYQARSLSADSMAYSPIASFPNSSMPIYNGNYLNWVLIQKAANFVAVPAGSGYYYNSAPVTRWTVANNVWHDLVDTKLSNIKVGISILRNTGTGTQLGANILLAPIDVLTGRSTLDALSPPVTPQSGSPIASAMAQIGQYFTTSITTGASITSTNAGTYFNIAPAFATGVSITSPITAACQQNFLLVISDGAANQDNASPQGMSTALKTYYTGPVTGNWIPNVAKALYETDLAPNLNDSQGNAVLNNMRTYTISYGTANASTPGSLSMQDAARVGGGLYANAVDGTALAQIAAAMALSIMAQIASGTNITFNSSSLKADSSLYQASFNTGKNTGDLQKLGINLSTGSVSTTPTWSLQSLLQTQATTVTAPATQSTRLLFTNISSSSAKLFNANATVTPTTSSLANLSAAQQADLNMGPSGTADAKGSDRIAYLRGISSGTAVTGFRVRDKVLGDIVNSSPIYVGPPAAGLYPTDPTYSSFVTANASRTPMVYMGDNSGIFHGINASTGNEVFGFLPLNLFSSAAGQGYHYLTDPSYVHRFYINGPMSIADVKVGTAETWKTVLVSGEGAGGQSYFALNVTDPVSAAPSISDTANSIFLWSFSNADNADLGYTFSDVVFGKMNNGKWAAIFGNGYNSGTGVAKLFILYLNTDTSSWINGTNYVVLNTNSAGNSSNPDGLSSPTAVDLDNNGTIDRIYAGSIQGKIYSFDVSNASATNWGAGKTVVDVGQPITAAPLVLKHPSVVDTTSNYPNTMVYFGTGQFLTSSDRTDTAARGLYGVWDNNNSGTTATTSQLVAQTFTASSTPSNTRTVSNNPVDYANGKRGWSIALTGGERSILSPRPASGSVFFATMQPNSASTVACTTDNGLGWILAIDQKIGGTTSTQILDTNRDGQITSADQNNGTVTVGFQFLDGYATGFEFLNGDMYLGLSNASVLKMDLQLPGLAVTPGRISVKQLDGV